MIVGAGPAGLEAARICAERGPRVTVLEAQSDPGGQINYAARIRWRQNMIGITRWLYERCVTLGVNVLVYDETGGQSGPTVSTPYRIYRMLVHSLFACSAPRFQ